MTLQILCRCIGYTSYFQSGGELYFLSQLSGLVELCAQRQSPLLLPHLGHGFINQPMRSQDRRILLTIFTPYIRLSRVAHGLISCASTTNTTIRGCDIIYHKIAATDRPTLRMSTTLYCQYCMRIYSRQTHARKVRRVTCSGEVRGAVDPSATLDDGFSP